jgi:hypothetical protein
MYAILKWIILMPEHGQYASKCNYFVKVMLPGIDNRHSFESWGHKLIFFIKTHAKVDERMVSPQTRPDAGYHSHSHQELF